MTVAPRTTLGQPGLRTFGPNPPEWCGLPRLTYVGRMLGPEEMNAVTPSSWRTSYVYHVFDDAGDLLYVGFTANPVSRWSTHRRKAKWWRLGTFLHIYAVRGRDCNTAAIAGRHWERLAISTARPMFNLLGPADLPAKQVG